MIESHYESKLFSSPNLAYFMKLFFLLAVLCVRGRFRRGLAEILIVAADSVKMVGASVYNKSRNIIVHVMNE